MPEVGVECPLRDVIIDVNLFVFVALTDDIITRGRGVTIHKADCVNVLRGEAERRVQVAWADGDTGTGFCVSIKIKVYRSQCIHT